MAEVGTIAFNSERLRKNGSSPLGEPVGFDVKGISRRLPRTDAPEGWIGKVGRHRQGKDARARFDDAPAPFMWKDVQHNLA
jgi:hypothetical protein